MLVSSRWVSRGAAAITSTSATTTSPPYFLQSHENQLPRERRRRRNRGSQRTGPIDPTRVSIGSRLPRRRDPKHAMLRHRCCRPKKSVRRPDRRTYSTRALRWNPSRTVKRNSSKHLTPVFERLTEANPARNRWAAGDTREVDCAAYWFPGPGPLCGRVSATGAQERPTNLTLTGGA